jgi:L-iditol 2-dehydrogenase
MKCVVFDCPHESHFGEVFQGKLAPGFARVRVHACAICATDLAAFDGTIPCQYPLIPGHEWAGVVEEVADPSYASWKGKRVTGSNDVTCGHCEACKRGEWRYCPDFKEVGFKLPGAYAEFVDVPERGLVELPKDIPFEIAALSEPLGVAFGSLKKAHLKAGESLTIFGPGPIGLSVLVAALSLGAVDPIVVGYHDEERLQLALKLGAKHIIDSAVEDPVKAIRALHQGGSDLVEECSGAKSAYQQAIDAAKKGGKVVLTGYGKGEIIPLRVDTIHVNNLKVIGAGNNWAMHPAAVDFLKNHWQIMSLFISKELPLERYQEGLQAVREKKNGFMKAVFVMDEKRARN